MNYVIVFVLHPAVLLQNSGGLSHHVWMNLLRFVIIPLESD